MSRTFMVCPEHAPHIQRRVFEVVHFERAINYIVLRWPSGALSDDTNFHIDMAKRVGYSLTAEIPPEFRS